MKLKLTLFSKRFVRCNSSGIFNATTRSNLSAIKNCHNFFLLSYLSYDVKNSFFPSKTDFIFLLLCSARGENKPENSVCLQILKRLFLDLSIKSKHLT